MEICLLDFHAIEVPLYQAMDPVVDRRVSSDPQSELTNPSKWSLPKGPLLNTNLNIGEQTRYSIKW